MAKEKGGGPTSLDLAHTVRNRGWYVLVKRKSRLSDHEIDRRFLKVDRSRDSDSRSIFGEKSSYARSPDKRERAGTRKSVYQLVTESGEFREAEKWFTSELWQLLTKPSQQRADYVKVIEDQIQSNGWQLTGLPISPLVELKSCLIGVYGPMYRRAGQVAPPGLDGISTYIVDVDADKLALLCALYREEQLQPRPQCLDDLRSVLCDAYGRFYELHPLGTFCDYELKDILWTLIDDRILHNRWVWKDEIPEENNCESEKKKLTRYIKWYCGKEKTLFGMETRWSGRD